jgi:tRNA pseudouridine13 synthase
MREAHPVERRVGIDYYVSESPGTGGVLRSTPEEFRVRELETLTPEPLDADPGAYGHLLVRATLREWDTNDFVGRLSDDMGISRERISWAGTKDKHAVTTQLFSLRGVDAADLPDVPKADVEPLGRIGRSLSFGDLAGNEFEIVVRDPERPDVAGTITDQLRAFAGGDGDGDGDGGVVGVPNYFGHQRFGSYRPVTHDVGLAALRGEWREAVLAYVANPYDTEPDATQDARRTVAEEAAQEDPDWRRALDAMPGYLGHERAMLHRLVENGGESPAEFRAALEAVPSNLQRLFVNAAQSYAFNRILSERLARGLPFDRPVAGDVVCFADGDAPEGLWVPDADRTQRVTDRRVDVVTRHCERGRAFVTAPLVGTDTEFGEGEPGDIERAVLDELDLVPGDFDLPGNFRSAGTRRAILVRTDLDVRTDPLSFTFALPHGSYATVLLREYLKSSPLDL